MTTEPLFNGFGAQILATRECCSLLRNLFIIIEIARRIKFTHAVTNVSVNHINTVRYLLDHVLPSKSEDPEEQLLRREDVTEEEIHAVIGNDWPKACC